MIRRIHGTKARSLQNIIRPEKFTPLKMENHGRDLPGGWISYYNQKGELLTEEYWRNRNRINRYCVPLRIDARELKPIPGSTDYELTMRFEAFDDEKIFGMGQYQEKNLNKKVQC